MPSCRRRSMNSGKYMRQALVNALTQATRKDTHIIVLTADMGYGVFEDFQKEFPDRFINTGVAEADTVGIAAGLALCGYTVVFYAQAAFATMRCYEQVRLDIAAHNLNVKIIGTSAGFALSQYGVSHHATEDIGIMRILPNFKVVAAADPREVDYFVQKFLTLPGPAYLRIGRQSGGPDRNLHPRQLTGDFGRGFVLRDGSDVLLIGHGTITLMAHNVAELLAGQGISCALASIPVVKPLDVQFLKDWSRKVKLLVTLEEHFLTGGFGSAIIEAAHREAIPTPILTFGLQDRYIHSAGSRDYYLRQHGLAPDVLAAKIKTELQKLQ